MVQKINFIIAMVWSLSAMAQPGNKTVDIANSTVVFLAIGKPSLIKIKGEGGIPQGAFILKNGHYSADIDVNLKAFKTGIETRDTHMKEKYLELSKPGFENTKLKIPSLAQDCIDITSTEKTCDFQGTLLLHGVEKPVKGKSEVKKLGDFLEAHADLNLKLSDYAINIPSFAGITVADEVNISVKILLK